MMICITGREPIRHLITGHCGNCMQTFYISIYTASTVWLHLLIDHSAMQKLKKTGLQEVTIASRESRTLTEGI